MGGGDLWVGNSFKNYYQTGLNALMLCAANGPVRTLYYQPAQASGPFKACFRESGWEALGEGKGGGAGQPSGRRELDHM